MLASGLLKVTAPRQSQHPQLHPLVQQPGATTIFPSQPSSSLLLSTRTHSLPSTPTLPVPGTRVPTLGRAQPSRLSTQHGLQACPHNPLTSTLHHQSSSRHIHGQPVTSALPGSIRLQYLVEPVPYPRQPPSADHSRRASPPLSPPLHLPSDVRRIAVDHQHLASWRASPPCAAPSMPLVAPLPYFHRMGSTFPAGPGSL
ncbi:hypothetical protein WJX72_010155 [[Myrmecia] bisecta]|uniref:Uncharacterized protein n=1 Tax=[Myrmecia] bisecta TaxID=41462 RepID=A0AAW1QS73_9CHLO